MLEPLFSSDRLWRNDSFYISCCIRLICRKSYAIEMDISSTIAALRHNRALTALTEILIITFEGLILTRISFIRLLNKFRCFSRIRVINWGISNYSYCDGRWRPLTLALTRSNHMAMSSTVAKSKLSARLHIRWTSFISHPTTKCLSIILSRLAHSLQCVASVHNLIVYSLTSSPSCLIACWKAQISADFEPFGINWSAINFCTSFKLPELSVLSHRVWKLLDPLKGEN